jgi:hypothetical protein
MYTSQAQEVHIIPLLNLIVPIIRALNMTYHLISTFSLRGNIPTLARTSLHHNLRRSAADILLEPCFDD